MVNQVKLTGIVLSASPVGEYDKRLVILTGQRGKITAFVKGARRPSSRFAAGSRPFSFGEFTLYQGREAYNLVDIDIKNYFDEIATDMNAMYYGFYFLELADYYSYENVNCKEMINLLYQSLKALSNKNIPDKLVRYIYELKMFYINGEYPDVFSCVECGNKDELDGFIVEKSKAVCKECSHLYKDNLKLNTSTFYTMQFIISTSIDKLYSFTVSEVVLKELSMLMNRWRTKYIDKEFKSLEFLAFDGTFKI